MSKRTSYTIGQILKELKEELPSFKKGMIFETLQTFFPDDKKPREEKNIVVNEQSFTKPLACSRKDKEKYIKENSPIADFHEEKTRGDFLRAVKINKEKGIAYCSNISLKEAIQEQYYSNELIPITYDDIVAGKIKIYRRKIEKFFK